MTQHSSYLAARLLFVAQLLVGAALMATTVYAQAVPHLRTTFVPRLRPEPNDCYQFSCFNRASYDGNTLAAIGALEPVVCDSSGSFSEESRVLPPSQGFFNVEKSLALHAWSVVVGNPGENSGTGAAYIFQRRSGQWWLTKNLLPEGAGANTRFGQAVGVDEYNVAVGAPGAVNPSGMGRGLVYVYTGVNDNWFISQEIAEPGSVEYPFGNTFGTAVTLRGRRLVISTMTFFLNGDGPPSYLLERGMRESSWVARATFAGDALSIDLSGNTAMVDRRGARGGTFPTVVNLPALRERDVAP